MKKVLLIITIFFISKWFLVAQIDRPLGMAINSKAANKDTIYCILVPNKEVKKKKKKKIAYKPKDSRLAFEFNFTPFGESPINLSSLKTRINVSEHSTIRLGLNLRVKNKNYDDAQVALTEIKEKFVEFGIHPGYEYHLEGTERLSPYWGIELNFVNRNCEREYTGATTGVLIGSNGTDRAFSSFGMNFFVGADYYILKHIYLGVELGYGFESKTNKEVKLNDATRPLYSKEQEFDAGVNFNSAIRLGICF